MPGTTRSMRHINASRERIYRLLIDRDSVQHWKVPVGMTCLVHTFEPREGGTFRISLTYDSPDAQGKTSDHTDTYHGRFISLVPHSLVVESVEFESTNPALMGEMTITYRLSSAAGGTDLVAVHEGVPDGVSLADNEYGWRMSLNKLAALAEAPEQD